MPNNLASWQPAKRRDAGAAERTGLENRSRGNSTGGSNPPLSANIQALTSLPFNDTCHTWYSVGIFPWYKNSGLPSEVSKYGANDYVRLSQKAMRLL